MLGINVLGASSAFTCKKTNNVFVCIPNTQDRLDSFLLLQNVIQKVAKAMAQAGRQLPFNLSEVGIDGRPGPTTTTAAKFITAVFAGKITPPPEVAALLDPNLTAEQGISLVAANSDAIGLYIGNTFRDHPEVLRDDPIVIVKEPPKYHLKPAALPVLGFSMLALSGIVAVSIYLGKGGGAASVLTGRR
jgi:hypothetical protein